MRPAVTFILLICQTSVEMGLFRYDKGTILFVISLSYRTEMHKDELTFFG